MAFADSSPHRVLTAEAEKGDLLAEKPNIIPGMKDI